MKKQKEAQTLRYWMETVNRMFLNSMNSPARSWTTELWHRQQQENAKPLPLRPLEGTYEGICYGRRMVHGEFPADTGTPAAAMAHKVTRLAVELLEDYLRGCLENGGPQWVFRVTNVDTLHEWKVRMRAADPIRVSIRLGFDVIVAECP